MSNLKKILAMVLAVAMLLSMGLTAGAGKFSDVKATDDYARAINLLASLDVLKGFEDGTYNAAGTYTREQFAKILYVLMNGKDDGASMYAGTSPFADVAADRWSAGYINWAKNAKVINGREDGLFWPTDIVTYAEAAKMFVVSMGYDSTVYTFPYGFIDKAQTLKLFNDVKGMSANAPANRGTVAQMAFNALFADAPRFGSYAAQIGTSSATETRFKTVAEGAFGMEETTTVLYATSTVALAMAGMFNDVGQVAIAGGIGSGDTELGEGAYDYDGNVDEYVGCEVVVWFRPAQSAAGTGDDTEEKLFDIQPSASNRIYDFTFADINDDDTTDEKLVVDVNGIEKKFSYALEDEGDYTTVLTLTLEGIQVDPIALFYDDDYDAGEERDDELNPTGLHSDKYRAIDWDNNGVLDAIAVMQTGTAKVSSITSTRVTLSNKLGTGGFTGTKDIEDDDVVQVVVADGIAKSDYVIVSGVNQYTAEGEKVIYSLTKATELENSKLSKASSGSYYFDGTKYKTANEANISFSTGDVGNKYDIVLNVNGRIVFCDKTASAVSTDKWILATEATITTTTSDDLIKSMTGYLGDGTKKTFAIADDLTVYDYTAGDELDVVIDEDYPTDEDADLFDGIVYMYDTNSSGEIDTLYTLDAVLFDNDSEYDSIETATGAATYSTSTTILNGTDADAAYIEDDTVIFAMYKNGASFKVIAASALKKLAGDEDYAAADDELGYGYTGLVDDDGAFAVVLLDCGFAASAPKKTTDSYGMLLKVEKDATDGDEYVYTFTVAYDGKVEELKSDSIDADDDFDDLVSDKILGIYKITFDGSGFVDDVTEAELDTDYQSIIINKVLSGALMGEVIDEGDFSEGVTLDYAVDATGVDMYTNDLADGVNVYQIDSFPIDGDAGTAMIATSLDNDVTIDADLDTSVLDESDDDLCYIATVIYDTDDDEITDIFYYLSPVEAD